MTNPALSAEVRSYNALRDWIAEQYNVNPDDPVVLDTLEGATNLHEMIASLAREARRRKANAEALATIIDENKKRKERHEAAAESIRSAIARAMLDAGLKRSEAPDATITVRMGESKPKVVSEELLPDWYWEEKIIRKPDMSEIKLTIELRKENGDSEPIPGVVMTNPAPILTIRQI